MTSRELTAANVDKIAELFPQVITETITGEGDEQFVKRAVDFDLLRQELADHLVEGPQERYRLDWPGKRAATFAANAPISKTLRPVREESVDFETTKNLFIEGDNLDALKLLQESYLGKIKLIYIDPPYNTGTDLIYRDDFSQDAGEYLQRSGQLDDGVRLVANLESRGRYHSDWLSMMLPRLKLARSLLTDDGLILVSINDVEVSNLRRVMDEIFGPANFVAQFVWVNDGNVDQQSKIKGVHEYVLAFARSIDRVRRPAVIDPNVEEDSKLLRDQIENTITKNGPANPPSVVELPVGFPAAFDAGQIPPREDAFPHVLDEIVVEGGRLAKPARLRSGWSSRRLLDLFLSNGCIPISDAEGRDTWFELRSTGAIYALKKRSEEQGHVLSVLRNMGTTQQNSSVLATWGLRFSYPKPVFLIEYLIRIFTQPDDGAIVLDFFAGSATTAHAVIAANARDRGDRRFVLVQLSEPAEGGSVASAGSIADLARRRIVASGAAVAGSQLGAAHAALDVGFRALRIDSTNMADVLRAPDQADQVTLDGFADNVKPGRTGEDLLFQVLIGWGLELSLPIGVDEVEGREIFRVDGDALVACFDSNIGLDVVEAIAKREPLRAVFRDSGFASDAGRINAEQIFRELSPATDVKVI